MVGEAEPNCGLFKIEALEAVNTEDEPAWLLFERTVSVTLAKRYFPAIASVGKMVAAV